MTSAFDKLNLRPLERRLVVVVGIVLFVVVQFIYIWPHFGDVRKMNVRRAKAITELETRRTVIAETNKFNAELVKLQGEGLDVPPEDQALQLMRTVQQEASKSGVNIQNTSKPFTRTNQFFLEQSQQISTLSDEGALVDFVFKLGENNSLIRVRDLTLRRDQSQTKLTATIKLVASYQKKSGGRPAPAPGRTPAAARPPKAAAVAPAPPASSTPTRK
jgi:Tfp pilus assembly protein PilO